MCALVVALAIVHAHAEILDRVLAVVSGDIILLSDITAARDLGLVVPPAGTADPTRYVLNRLMDRSLVLTEVDRYAPPEPAADAVDRQLAGVRARFPDAEAYRAALERSGIDEQRLRQILREDLRIRAYLDQRFTVAQPPEEEVVRYYREHPGAFTRDGRLLPFDQVRAGILQTLAGQRRTAMVDEWLAGLRRRAEISDLFVQGR